MSRSSLKTNSCELATILTTQHKRRIRCLLPAYVWRLWRGLWSPAFDVGFRFRAVAGVGLGADAAAGLREAAWRGMFGDRELGAGIGVTLGDTAVLEAEGA